MVIRQDSAPIPAEGARLAWEIWLQAFPNGTKRRLSPSGFFTCWSPDSKRLGWLERNQNEAGAEDYCLHLFDIDPEIENSPYQLHTPFPVEPDFAFSPDGSAIACFHSGTGILYRVAVSPASPGPAGKIQQLSSLPGPGRSLRWSPDGRWLAATIEANGQDTAIYLLPASPSTDASLAALSAPKQWLAARDAAFSPDSRSLVFCAEDGEWPQLRHVDLIQTATEISSIPIDLDAPLANISCPVFSPVGGSLAFILGKGPFSVIGLLHLETKQLQQVAPGRGVCYRPAFTPDGKALVFLFESPASPPALWIFRPPSASSSPQTHPRTVSRKRRYRRLVPSGPAGARPHLASLPITTQLKIPGGTLQYITYPSLHGFEPEFQEIPALLYLPQGSPRAAVVYVHGGPNWQSQAGWDKQILQMLRYGWLVLAPNYRGSTGYGRRWQHANYLDPGGGDCNDIIAAATFLRQEQFIQSPRIALVGRSYGAYLILMAMVRAPEQWAAASAVAPFLTWFNTGVSGEVPTNAPAIRPDVRRWDLENFGDPEQNPELFRQRSPLLHLSRVQAPLQLITGGLDDRCPASESLQASVILQNLGKIVDLCLYPNEGHEFQVGKNITNSRQQQIDFLATYLPTWSSSDAG